MKRILLLIIFFFLLSTNASFANSQKGVLGASDENLNIPPTVEGPGIFLPDSPFFFLDEIKQKVRLILAFTPEQKALVYSNIAGERMAELRFMIAKNNVPGIRLDLIESSDSFKKSAEELNFAKLSGKNVSVLAKEINDDIKQKVAVIDELQLQSSGEMKGQLRAASEGLMSAKIKIENDLNEADLENEVRDDVDRETNLDLRDASQLSANLKISIDELQKEASDAAKQSLDRREAILKKAIDDKNVALQKEQEKLLAQEQSKNSKIINLGQRTAEDIELAKQKVDEAVKKFEELKSKKNSNLN